MVMSVFVTLEVPEKASSRVTQSRLKQICLSATCPQRPLVAHYDLRVYSRDNLAHLTYNQPASMDGRGLDQGATRAVDRMIASIGHDLPKFTSRWELRERVPPPVRLSARLSAYMPTSPAYIPTSAKVESSMQMPQAAPAPLAASAMVALPPRHPSP
ncbi:hypothetical protein BCR44DRAFT_1209770 [Catenaria anguillulae PL171]|uniref:Uncharacterized protein n=1 Tax=Catenaria anguillulae PL171 TaxID=765915 RepID=A0A1Y2GXY9_9FUNG|nr:hypothetical protein BCR44DRAFT_1209770 [Catenaria anguillulae PL171]